VDTVHEFDRQTDSQKTDRITITKTAPHTASRGKKSLAVCVCAHGFLGPNIWKALRERLGTNGQPIANVYGESIGHLFDDVTLPRHVTLKGQGRDPKMFGPLSRKRLEIQTQLP